MTDLVAYEKIAITAFQDLDPDLAQGQEEELVERFHPVARDQDLAPGRVLPHQDLDPEVEVSPGLDLGLVTLVVAQPPVWRAEEEVRNEG